MPSFIVHSVAGEELSKRLGFDKKTHNKFFVANLLPDTVQLERDPNLSPEELRKAIQKKNMLVILQQILKQYFLILI